MALYKYKIRLNIESINSFVFELFMPYQRREMIWNADIFLRLQK